MDSFWDNWRNRRSEKTLTAKVDGVLWTSEPLGMGGSLYTRNQGILCFGDQLCGRFQDIEEVLLWVWRWCWQHYISMESSIPGKDNIELQGLLLWKKMSVVLGLWMLMTAWWLAGCIVVWIPSSKDPKLSHKGTFVDGFDKPKVCHHLEFKVWGNNHINFRGGEGRQEQEKIKTLTTS